MITPAMSRRLVGLACLAPSMHNTQPWRWRLDGGDILLYADLDRQLPVEDPSGRNLTISCGAALHHLRFAAHALSWDTEVERFPDGTDSDLLARIRPSHGVASATPLDDLDALRVRCTDRRRFTSWPVPDMELEALAAEAVEAGASALAVTDATLRFRCERLVNAAHDLRAEDVSAVEEQNRWLARTGSDGIPMTVLPERGDDPEALPRSRFLPGLVRETRNGLESGDGLIILGAAVDEREAWLRTGEALGALWLRATRAGMSVVPLSVPVEVDDVRQTLHERVLGQAFTPHILVRIGWQAIGRSDLPRTQRRPLSEVLLP